MRQTAPRLFLVSLIVILSLTSAVSSDGQNRSRRKRKASARKVLTENKVCLSEAQTPMPSSTYLCEFGIVDLICGDCLAGKLISQPLLDYPRVAKVAKIRGWVRVKSVVDERGEVIWAQAVNDAHPLLKSAAVSEACQRKYEPFVCGGRAVKAVVYVSYKFGVP
jgi:hypothetical protein